MWESGIDWWDSLPDSFRVCGGRAGRCGPRFGLPAIVKDPYDDDGAGAFPVRRLLRDKDAALERRLASVEDPKTARGRAIRSVPGGGDRAAGRASDCGGRAVGDSTVSRSRLRKGLPRKGAFDPLWYLRKGTQDKKRAHRAPRIEPTAERVAVTRFRISKAQRIRSSLDFERIYAGKNASAMAGCSSSARSNELEVTRFGLQRLPQTRQLGETQNRLKRLLREAFRLTQHDLPTGIDPASRSPAEHRRDVGRFPSVRWCNSPAASPRGWKLAAGP